MKRDIPWLAVIICLVFSLPLGVILLILKLNNGKPSKASSGKVAGAIVIVFIAVLVISALSTALTEHGGYFGVPFFVMTIWAIFIIGIIFARARNKNNATELYKRYLNAIGTKKTVPFSALATAVGVPESQVETDLNKMISVGFLKGYTVDSAAKVLLATASTTAPASDGPIEPSAGTHVYKCKNCGACTIIHDGELPICEYCGSPLE